MRRSIGIALAVSLVVVACGGADDAATDTTESPGTTTARGTSADPSVTTTRPLYGTVAPDGDDAEAEITIEDFSFGAPIEVSTGETVTVTNADGAPHTWTAEDGTFDSGTIGGGETFEYAFDEPGTFAFFCEIHPGMTGTITVTG